MRACRRACVCLCVCVFVCVYVCACACVRVFDTLVRDRIFFSFPSDHRFKFLFPLPTIVQAGSSRGQGSVKLPGRPVLDTCWPSKSKRIFLVAQPVAVFGVYRWTRIELSNIQIFKIYFYIYIYIYIYI